MFTETVTFVYVLYIIVSVGVKLFNLVFSHRHGSLTEIIKSQQQTYIYVLKKSINANK